MKSLIILCCLLFFNMVRIADILFSARLIRRENRFVGIIEVDGKTEYCHILNPGRMITFLLPGAELLVSYNNSPRRKLKYSLIYVKAKKSLILIDSIFSNRIVGEALKNRQIPEFENVCLIEAEKKYGKDLHSRIDFLLDSKRYIEVKSTNYENNGIGYFPDAPSVRAQKHVKELTDLVKSKLISEAYIFFIAQRTDIVEIRPFDAIDPEFGRLLRIAKNEGVKLRAYSLVFDDNGLEVQLGSELTLSL